MKDALFYFVIGIIQIALGVLMILENVSIVGRDYLTQEGTVTSGYFLISVGLLIIWVGYYSLSPFSKIRKFIEGNIFKSRKKK